MMNYTRTVLTILAAALLTAACGKEEAPKPAAQSFGSATAAQTPADAAASPAAATPPAGSAAPEATPAPTGAGVPGGQPPASGDAGGAATPSASPGPAPRQSPALGAAAAGGSAQPAAAPSGGTAAGTAPAASAPPQKNASAGSGTADKTPAAAKPSAAPAKSSSPVLKWTEFFDDEKQATPSNKFWDLNGKSVEIRGFMGEVLSFDKHWFLLIPAPGAECPFDNGDETYWNKIMIVFVPKETKLRYTSGPLKIKGRLDVGIKIDESGYKTMFRLYDASFESIKE
ncbi:hypothetical protein YDYSY3_34870 [Paenibacillus chitinolyticus]|uniref:hypothetical protein n=1 Tax=Paenibacillus chitinolyticus TaxID=79263 RepID=UPI0026E49823|nr:hypothetical protein [Paenibacillus chitinolyticus]GKS12487.1 hypothetical protein YDYSY3_34870 [Paenibacillus chitinolyticus]